MGTTAFSHWESASTAGAGGAALSCAEPRPSLVGTPAREESRDGRLRRLFEEQFDFLWRATRRLGLTAAEADDAVQQVFIVASRKLDAILPGKERAFLFGTAVRVVSDVRRSASRRYEVAFEELAAREHDGADVALDAARARACLDAAIVEMPIELRTVFVLFELEQLTMAKIAELLELPPGTVASRLRRAREAFEAAMTRLRRRFGGAA